jgi:transposase-like protein
MSKYTIKQKDQAVKFALQSSSIALAAKQLNIPDSTLQDWVKEYRVRHQNNTRSDQPDLRKELTKKDKEIKKLKEELEILKKFQAFSAKIRR